MCDVACARMPGVPQALGQSGAGWDHRPACLDRRASVSGIPGSEEALLVETSAGLRGPQQLPHPVFSILSSFLPASIGNGFELKLPRRHSLGR